MPNRLSIGEQQALQELHRNRARGFTIPSIAVFAYLFGGLLGWISILVFLFFMGFDLLMMGFVGLLMMGVAFYADIKERFEPLLVLSLMILGHIHLVVALEESFRMELITFVALEAVITLVTFLFYTSVIYRVIQSLTLFSLIFLLPFEYRFPAFYSYALLVASWLLLLYLWYRPKADYLFLRDVLMITQTGYMLMLMAAANRRWAEHYYGMEQITTLVATLFFAATLFYNYPKLRRCAVAVGGVIALGLIGWFASLGIVITLWYLQLSTFTHERLLRILSIILLSIFIFQYYYALYLPLDQKGGMLIISGLISLLLAFGIKKGMHHVS